MKAVLIIILLTKVHGGVSPAIEKVEFSTYDRCVKAQTELVERYKKSLNGIPVGVQFECIEVSD